MSELYDILQVPKGCSQEEMKKSYKKLCIKHHPDKGGDEEVFKKISEAYNILKDPQKREVYDRFGMEGLTGGGGGHPGGMEDMMRNMFGGGGGFRCRVVLACP